jgi:hypothetical protein
LGLIPFSWPITIRIREAQEAITLPRLCTIPGSLTMRAHCSAILATHCQVGPALSVTIARAWDSFLSLPRGPTVQSPCPARLLRQIGRARTGRRGLRMGPNLSLASRNAAEARGPRCQHPLRPPRAGVDWNPRVAVPHVHTGRVLLLPRMVASGSYLSPRIAPESLSRPFFPPRNLFLARWGAIKNLDRPLLASHARHPYAGAMATGECER